MRLKTGPNGPTRRAIMGSLSAAAALPFLPRAWSATRVRKSPLTLWYERPAAAWTEALPVGNGRIGAMIFGGIAKERLQLNEDTLWGGGPYDPVNPQAKANLPELRRLIFAGRYAEAEAFANAHVMATPLRQASYKPIGDLAIEMVGIRDIDATGYHRALDIDSAVAETRFTAGGITYARSVLASPVDQVVAVRLSANRPGKISCRLSFTSPEKASRSSIERSDTLVLSGRNDPEGAIAGALTFEARLRARSRGGTIRPDGDALVIDGADEIVLLIAMATSYRRYDDVSGDPTAITRAQIDKAAARSFAAIAADTTAEHRRLFRRVAIDLGRTDAADQPTDVRIKQSETVADPALAALYFQYGRYLLISCSRPGGQAANLQGLWNESPRPPWGSKYTININTEMNYWPAEPTNLPECVEPLIQLIRDIAQTGERTARDMYGARGWVCHHNTDLWRATAPIDGAKFGLWPMGGAWLCTHLWAHYDYDRDKAFLASVYPILRGASLFFLDTLQTDPTTGHLVTNPSMSPENGHGHGSSLIYAPTMDMEILRDLFDQTVAAAGILGRDADLAKQIADARARLLPLQIGVQGQLQEWPMDWDMQADDLHHRHVSHLYGLFPSHQIDIERTPDLARAAKKSLEIRGDKATGWATAWRINLWARLRDGDHAHSILAFLLGPERTYPNMFDAHPPFQIDGNFGGTSGITEMLMQCQDDIIDLLPALPSAWPTGSISGLRARGGCTVDLAWRDGKLARAAITGSEPGSRRVRCAGRSIEVEIVPGKPVPIRPVRFA
jgi:alpha-L-fucosidase 2